MYYEVYVDTLFLVNFVMNLYLLMLTNLSVRRTATRLRMVVAAAFGAAIYILGLVLAFLPLLLHLTLQAAAASLLMIRIAFRPCNLEGYKKLLETLLAYSFFVGGAIYLVMGYMEGMADVSVHLALVMGLGGILYLFGSYLLEKRKKERGICTVTLSAGERQEQVVAILDTGNGLIEPISGEPVSVVNLQVLERLWPEGLPAFYRAIPFHSIGKTGILQGYLIERMQVEQGGIVQDFEQVYVAAGEQGISSREEYDMILNPRQIKAE